MLLLPLSAWPVVAMVDATRTTTAVIVVVVAAVAAVVVVVTTKNNKHQLLVKGLEKNPPRTQALSESS